MKEKKRRAEEQEYLRRNEKKGGGKERGLHEVEKKESRGAIIFEQGSTHVLPGSQVFKKSQSMRCRISSECAGTEKEKETNNDLSTSE